MNDLERRCSSVVCQPHRPRGSTDWRGWRHALRRRLGQKETHAPLQAVTKGQASALARLLGLIFGDLRRPRAIVRRSRRRWCRTERRAADRNRADGLGQWRRRRRQFFCCPENPGARIRMWDTASHERPRRTMQRIHLRRQRIELTGYSLKVRLLGFGALGERHQHICALLLRRLDIPQYRAGDGIRHGDRSRFGWSLRGNAIGFQRSYTFEIREREVIETRQRDLIEFRQREAIEIRQGEAWQRDTRQGKARQRDARQGEAWQKVRGGRADDGQCGQGHHCHCDAGRSPLRHRPGLLVCLRLFVRRLSHLRSLSSSAQSQQFPPPPISKTKRAIAWTIQR